MKAKASTGDVTRNTPERDLWAAVMWTALLDISAPATRTYEVTDTTIYKSLSHKDTAEAWVFSDEFEIGSFLWVCQLLDMNPETLRQGITRVERTGLKGRVVSLHRFGPQNDTWGRAAQ